MADLLTNIAQVCADLTNIKTSIIDAGVSVGAGTPTSEYANKVSEVYEIGKQAEYDAFWDEAQNNGTRTMYAGAFAGGNWTERTLNPKYVVRPTANGAYNLFMFCNFGRSFIDFRRINDKFNFSETIGAGNMFQDARIDYIDVDLPKCTTLVGGFSEGWASGVKTTISLYITEKCTSFASCFNNCTALTSLTFKEGSVIAASIDLKHSPLSRDSIISVVNALSSSTTGLTATFKKSAKEAAFTADEWSALIANKTNWTFSLV